MLRRHLQGGRRGGKAAGRPHEEHGGPSLHKHVWLAGTGKPREEYGGLHQPREDRSGMAICTLRVALQIKCPLALLSRGLGLAVAGLFHVA